MKKLPRDARAETIRVGALLTAYDFGDKAVQCVSQNHDGATFYFPDAFLLRYHDWYLVFTEHYGYFYFHEEDMLCWELKSTGRELSSSRFRVDPKGASVRRTPLAVRRRRAEDNLNEPLRPPKKVVPSI